MAQKKKTNGNKLSTKKTIRKPTAALKTKSHRKRVASVKRSSGIERAPVKLPIAAEAQVPTPTVPMLKWANMPLAIMNMWLAPFERRT